jgi:hypothetical protein
MDLCSLDFSYNELLFVRQSLELPTISGKDAKFLASLQVKFEEAILQFEEMKRQEEVRKEKERQQIIGEQKSNKAK